MFDFILDNIYKQPSIFKLFLKKNHEVIYNNIIFGAKTVNAKLYENNYPKLYLSQFNFYRNASSSLAYIRTLIFTHLIKLALYTLNSPRTQFFIIYTTRLAENLYKNRKNILLRYLSANCLLIKI